MNVIGGKSEAAGACAQSLRASTSGFGSSGLAAVAMCRAAVDTSDQKQGLAKGVITPCQALS